MRGLLPKRLLCLLLVAIISVVCAAAGTASAKSDAGKGDGSHKLVFKSDAGDQDLFAALNGKSEESKQEKEPPAYVTALSFIFKLALVLGIAYVSILGLKKFSNFKTAVGGNSQRIRVMENSSLGANRSLHVVQVGSKKLLVASTPSQVNLLAELDSEDMPTDGAPQAPPNSQGFKEQFSAFMGNRPDSVQSAKSVADMLRESSMHVQEKIFELGRFRKQHSE